MKKPKQVNGPFNNGMLFEIIVVSKLLWLFIQAIVVFKLLWLFIEANKL